MHDLNTIKRLNGEAFTAAVDNFRRQGRYVLAVYAGVHLMSIESFSTDAEAAQAAADRTARLEASEHLKVYPPIAAPQTAVPTRDQSEDTGASFATLQDYLDHVIPKEAAVGIFVR